MATLFAVDKDIVTRAGKYPDTNDGLASYLAFSGAEYLFAHEDLYRDVDIASAEWEADPYTFIYYLEPRERTPLLRGMTYGIAAPVYRKLAHVPVYGELAEFRALQCEQRIAVLMGKEQWVWQSIPRQMGIALLERTAVTSSVAVNGGDSSANDAPISPNRAIDIADTLSDTLRELDELEDQAHVRVGVRRLSDIGFAVPFDEARMIILQSLAPQLESFIHRHPLSMGYSPCAGRRGGEVKVDSSW